MSGETGSARNRKVLATIAAAAMVAGTAFFLMKQHLPSPTEPAPNAEPDRVAAARLRCGAQLRESFARAGVRWPADEVFLRVMKRERVTELWARNANGERFTLVKTLPILAASGGPGPKRREGDLQVPEGFYEVDRFNPQSSFHLSLGLNYPNAYDRIHADPVAPGFDIFLHGGAASIGCVALGDEAIEEIYLAALDSRTRPVRVHLFPGKMDAPDWPAWRDAQLARHPEFRGLWDELAVAWERFSRERR
jgi:hypothetical protein